LANFKKEEKRIFKNQGSRLRFPKLEPPNFPKDQKELKLVKRRKLMPKAPWKLIPYSLTFKAKFGIRLKNNPRKATKFPRIKNS